MSEYLTRNMAGVEFDIDADLPIAPDHGACAAFSGAAGDADIRVKVHLTRDEFRARGEMVRAFDAGGAWTMYRDGDDRVIRSGVPGSPLWTAVFRGSPEEITIHCGDRLLTEIGGVPAVSSPVRYPLDQILMMYVLARRGGVIVHGCGARIGGKGLLMAGKSGAGKSTIARLLSGKKDAFVLSDDRLIVRRGRDGVFRMFGTPWPGEGGMAENAGVTLDRLLFLSHAFRNEIRPLDGPSAAERLMQVASVPWYDADVLPDVLSFCDAMLRAVQAYELSFAPSGAAADMLEDWAAGTCEGLPDGQCNCPGHGRKSPAGAVRPDGAVAAADQDHAAKHAGGRHPFRSSGSGIRSNLEKEFAVSPGFSADAMGDNGSLPGAAETDFPGADLFCGAGLDGKLVAAPDGRKHAGAVRGEAQGVSPAKYVGGKGGEVGPGKAYRFCCHTVEKDSIATGLESTTR